MRNALLSLSLAFVVGCAASAPAPAAAPVAKPAPAAVPAPVAKFETIKPAPVVEVKPVTVDLTKHKAPVQGAELFGYNDGEGKVFYYTAGVVEFAAKVAADGAYQIVVKASCDEAMGQKAKFKLWIDGVQVGGETTLTAVEEKEYALPATLKAGDRKIGLEFTNDLYKENEYDLNFYVHGVTVKPAK